MLKDHPSSIRWLMVGWPGERFGKWVGRVVDGWVDGGCVVGRLVDEWVGCWSLTTGGC